MPCAVSQNEIESYERMHNIETYGVDMTHGRLVETVACHLAQMLESNTPLHEAPEFVKIWIKNHKAKDANRGTR
jgi:hypothetical protein